VDSYCLGGVIGLLVVLGVSARGGVVCAAFSLSISPCGKESGGHDAQHDTDERGSADTLMVHDYTRAPSRTVPLPERMAATMKPLPIPTSARRAQSKATLAAMKPRMEKAAVLSRP